MSRTLQPINDSVFIKRRIIGKKTGGGIELPDSVGSRETDIADVIAVAKYYEGVSNPLLKDIAVGDAVLVSQHRALKAFDKSNNSLLIVDVKDILAKTEVSNA